MSKRKSPSSAFARGNKAASKGEPRTRTLTVRIPDSTDAEIRRRAEWEGLSRSDVIIAAVRFSPGYCGEPVRRRDNTPAV